VGQALPLATHGERIMRILRPLFWAALMVAAFVYITEITHWDLGGVRTATHQWTEPSPASAAPGGFSADEQNNIDIYKTSHDATVNITSKVMRENWFGQIFPQEGTGSGFVINADGEILTNNHVVVDPETGRLASQLTVKFADQKEYPGQVIGRDPRSDLAIIKIKATGKLTSLKLGDSDGVVVGQKVLAIGNPFGYEGTLTTGIVSSLNRSIQTEGSRVPLEGMIQTDAAINPGNSGGPLLDSHGNVIGINTAILGQGNIGIGFATPINRAKTMLEEFQKRGHISQATLGISVVYVAGDLAQELQLPSSGGLLIQNVEDGSAAATAGLHTGSRRVRVGMYPLVIGGDLITTVDGQKVEGSDTLQRVMNRKHGGDELNLTVYRNGKSETVKVKLGEAPVVI
jgi:S1-C subfamily serine protease